MDEDKARMEIEEDSLEDSFQKTFGWHIITNRVASNDFTKHEQVYQATITEILNQLSYLIQYDREQEKQYKKLQSQR